MASENPIMAVSGVRISWLIFDRKSLLALLAASASSLAWLSSSVRSFTLDSRLIFSLLSSSSACLRRFSRAKVSSAKLTSEAICWSSSRASSSNALTSPAYRLNAPTTAPLVCNGSAAEAFQPCCRTELMPRCRFFIMSYTLVPHRVIFVNGDCGWSAT